MRKQPLSDDDLLTLMGGGDVEDQGELTSYLGEQADMADTELAAPIELSPEDEQDALAILAETGGELPTEGEPQPQMQLQPRQPSEAIQRLEALGQQPATGPELPEPPMVQPKPAPKGKSGFDTTMDVLALFLDAMLNDGKNIPGLIGNMQQERTARASQQPGDTDYENYKRRIQHAKDVSGLQPKGPSQLDLEKARLEREKFEASEGRLERQRGESLADFQKRQEIALANRKALHDYTKADKYRNALAVSGKVSPEYVDQSREQLIQFLDSQGFSPEEQTPYLVRLDDAKRLPGKNRVAAVQKVWTDAGKTAEGRGEDVKQAKAKQAETARKNTESFGKEIRTRGLDKAQANLANVRRVLAENKIGKEADIPGYGQTGLVPQPLLTAGGKEMRRAVNELLDTKLRIATGANAPISEVKTFREILGVGDLATDADLRSALKQVEFLLNEQTGYVREMYPEAAQANKSSQGSDGGGEQTYNIVAPDGRSTTKQLTAAAALKLKSKGYEVTSAGR